eukprot:4102363-Amphidinium_carterae.1
MIGTWPAVEGGVPKTQAATDLQNGTKKLLRYLQQVGYCKDFKVSEFQKRGDGVLTFVSFVEGPVNLEATKSLMR